MARERFLSNAPIREAVLDIRIPVNEDVVVGALEKALMSLDDFGQVHELKRGAAVFRFSAEGSPETEVQDGDVIGFRGTTRDGLWVAQLRRDGLTFSRLPPYAGWSDFSARARPYIERLLEVAAPPTVERLALRYINHFRLPYPTRMEEYFVGLPSFPPPLPQFVSNLLYRATLHDPGRDFTAHVTNAVLDDMDTEKMGYILDIDAFRTTEFLPEARALWETFEGLRVFKNQIFFGLITEQNAELHE